MTTTFVDGWNQVRVLGEGTYGEVRLLVSTKGETVAMKVINLQAANQHGQIDAVKREIQILNLLKGHENIVRYYSHRSTPEFAYIFLEYADGGELFDQINPDVGMPSSRAQYYFRQLVNGVSFMHRRGITHRDIKPENILLTVNDVIKISDFGLATVFFLKNRGERLCHSRCGTLPYAAPEVLSSTGYRGPPADIWSCGVVLVAMLVGQLPWDRPTEECAAFLAWCRKENHNRDPWKRIGTGVMALLCSILKADVKLRATIEDIQKNPWFTCDLSRQPPQLTRIHSCDDPPMLPCRRLLNEMNEPVQGQSQPLYGNSDFSTHCDSEISAASSTKTSDQNSSLELTACSFSQPADMTKLLIGSPNTQYFDSQSQDLNELQRFVRRMTRFFMNVDLATAMAEIEAACLQFALHVKITAPNQLTASGVDARRDLMRFKVTFFDMSPRVLVDFRRSQGDGLEFKRMFLRIKGKLSKLICRDGVQWLESTGYVINEQIACKLQQLSQQTDLTAST